MEGNVYAVAHREHVPVGVTREAAYNGKAVWVFCGKVFGAVDGDVRGAVQKGVFNFFCEEAFARRIFRATIPVFCRRWF